MVAISSSNRLRFLQVLQAAFVGTDALIKTD